MATAKGGVMNHCILDVDYTLYDKEGDSITHAATGEAIDRGDKAINKAMTAAFKYFLFQAFCIPVESEQDADSGGVELTGETVAISPQQKGNITKLIKASDSSEEAFVAWVTEGKASKLAEMPASLYDRAVAALKRKIETMEEAGSEE